ncbi:HNH endonuclease [Enterococcus alishanensis]
MVKFERISATDQRFVAVKELYSEHLHEFYDYANMLTQKAGRVKVKSNKAASYEKYLVRFIILYEDYFKDDVPNLLTFESLFKFKKVSALDGFKEFNKETNHFFSATLNCFTSFLSYKNQAAELISDEILNNELSQLSKLQEQKPNTNLKSPKKKPNKSVQTPKGNAYLRDINEAIQAKKNSNWQCEMDSSHTTFISETDKMPFVEAHHLIPMSVQDSYIYSLDFADNIVSLCPNCHRLVHHSTSEIRKKALEKLFKTRKDKYKIHGIGIDRKTLLTYYGII